MCDAERTSDGIREAAGGTGYAAAGDRLGLRAQRRGRRSRAAVREGLEEQHAARPVRAAQRHAAHRQAAQAARARARRGRLEGAPGGGRLRRSPRTQRRERPARGRCDFCSARVIIYLLLAISFISNNFCYV